MAHTRATKFTCVNGYIFCYCNKRLCVHYIQHYALCMSTLHALGQRTYVKVKAAFVAYLSAVVVTPDRWQSKTLSTIYEQGSKIARNGSKIARNSVFECQLSPVGRQMAIKISVSNYF